MGVGILPSVETLNLKGKTVVVTGANTGIGKVTAREIARTGARVILACRSQARADQAREDIVNDTNNEDVVVKLLDLSSLQSVRDFARDFNANEKSLDLLVNNAGVWTTEKTLTKDGFEMMFGTNHLGHFLLTNLLLDKLKASAPSRIVTVASYAHEGNPINLEDLQNGSYGQSKAANILFTVHLAKLLEGSGVTAYSLHPGVIQSDLYGNFGCLNNPCTWCCFGCIWRCFKCEKVLTPEEGADTTLYCCLEPSIAQVSGRYYSDCKEKPAKPHATNPITAQKLWAISVDLVGLQQK